MKTAVVLLTALLGLHAVYAQVAPLDSIAPEFQTASEFRVRLETPFCSIDTMWVDTADWRFDVARLGHFSDVASGQPAAWRIDHTAANRFLLLPLREANDTAWTATWSCEGLDTLNWQSAAGSCYPPLIVSAFDGFLSEVLTEPFERKRAEKIELWALDQCLTPSQLRQLLLSIASEDRRVALLESLLPYCVERKRVNIDGLFVLSSMARKAANALSE
jgi:hypothetical protein